jgi:hypothetical protein
MSPDIASGCSVGLFIPAANNGWINEEFIFIFAALRNI